MICRKAEDNQYILKERIKMPEQVKVSEIMSENVYIIDIDENIQTAAHMMREKNVSGLIVIENGNAVAVLALDDIVKKVVAENISPMDVKVRDIMSSSMITAQVDERLTDVAMKMGTNDVSRIPVLDSKGNLKGIITKTDILKTMPAIVNYLYEKEAENEITPTADRSISDGICEDCGNHSDELRNVDNKWICQECEELKNI
ncbi:MAG: CBS domain-containing protein [Nanohaloarchaea archaeon]|nr:CBS domain-containing protein [Candidatus Nanohaloarchaea archaeon]